MALQVMCENGHPYIQPDIIGEMMDLPVCPECRAELEWITIKDLQRVQLKPGDVLVVRAENIMHLEYRLRLRKILREAFPGHEVVVLERGLELCVVGNESP